jgi:hypothetical protein
MDHPTFCRIIHVIPFSLALPFASTCLHGAFSCRSHPLLRVWYGAILITSTPIRLCRHGHPRNSILDHVYSPSLSTTTSSALRATRHLGNLIASTPATTSLAYWGLVWYRSAWLQVLLTRERARIVLVRLLGGLPPVFERCSTQVNTPVLCTFK